MNKDRCKIYENYGKFLDSFIVKPEHKDNIDNYKEKEISREIYRQLFKIHYFAHKYSNKLNRSKNHSLADIFQDIIAYYLKIFLDDEYEILLEKYALNSSQEEKKKKAFRPDILIKKDDKPYFIIEIKTNLGWERNSIKNDTFKNRIKNMSSIFDIKEDNIIYILESPGNVNNDFLNIYYNKEKKEAQENHPTDIPYKNIYPLFFNPNPYYMTDDFERSKIFLTDITDEEIEKVTNENIITPFESIIKMINKGK